jgi:hypothetical protein
MSKVKALKQYLGCKKSEIEEGINDNTFEHFEEQYLVVTDEEADDLWEESLDNYLEDCIYPKLSGNLSNYFDDEAWKRDARYDGRGHSLSGYDGEENEEVVTYKDGSSETFYIYRTN